MHPIARSYKTVLEHLPVDRREEGIRLPYEIGIAKDKNGGWEDYSSSAPLYDMPLYVLENAGTLDSIDSSRIVEPFRIAHHCAGFYGLLCDRLADGQCDKSEMTDYFKNHFRSCWVKYLAIAAKQREQVMCSIVESVIDLWEQGIQMDKRLIGSGKMTVISYAELIILKVRWLSLASIYLLKALGQIQRIPEFQLVFNLMLLGMQCRDDAVDHQEDTLLNSMSYPKALGVSPGALYRAGASLLRRGIHEAEEFHFHRLASWLGRHHQTPYKTTFDECPELDIFGGWLIFSGIESVIPDHVCF